MGKITVILAVLFMVNSESEFDPRNHKNWKLIRHDICGLVGSERIIGGEDAPMNAYPWLARIGYVTSESQEVHFYCGGVIATSETIVTAAHCVTNLPNQMKVAVVRLGEHDSETDPDCEEDFCADPVVDLKPKDIIIPKDYDKIPLKDDIALIRLGEKIKFTAFVKPICFMNGELYKKNLVGSMGEVAGWGTFDIDNPKSSTVPQVVKLAIVGEKECRDQLPRYVNFGPTQLCVGGKVGKDSCNGDSGGPLMNVDDSNGEPRYYLLGLVSFGSKKCGKTAMPGVYTKMSAYMKWFLDNLKKTSRDSKKIL